jgi:hypothetical protein
MDRSPEGTPVTAAAPQPQPPPVPPKPQWPDVSKPDTRGGNGGPIEKK